MSDGRRSLVSIFAVSVLLTFFAKKPIVFSWSGVAIEERYIWVCLAIALVYCVAMAYTKGAFRSVSTGNTNMVGYLKDPSVRPHRIGEFLSLYTSRLSAFGSLVMIVIGLYQAFGR